MLFHQIVACFLALSIPPALAGACAVMPLNGYQHLLRLPEWWLSLPRTCLRCSEWAFFRWWSEYSSTIFFSRQASLPFLRKYLNYRIHPAMWFVLGFMMLITSYIRTAFTSPGVARGEKGVGVIELKRNGTERFCQKCETYKPDRAHHCHTCQTCVVCSCGGECL